MYKVPNSRAIYVLQQYYVDFLHTEQNVVTLNTPAVLVSTKNLTFVFDYITMLNGRIQSHCFRIVGSAVYQTEMYYYT